MSTNTIHDSCCEDCGAIFGLCKCFELQKVSCKLCGVEWEDMLGSLTCPCREEI